MSKRDDLPYRPCVGAMLINRDGLVFLGNRIQRAGDGDDAWQMPQGGIDPGEDLLAAARRELHEETNVTSAEYVAEAPDWYSYDVPEDLATGRFQKKWRGQTQKWFAFRFTGADDEIDVAHPAGGVEKPEFDSWRWERLDRVPGLIVPFKRPVYDKVCAAFAHLAAPW
ncbi:MAG TPA: RNA pyrophosphohydrolase [Methylomirabilota bacterium]|nr:RNA pyrophosphohydrolase [Methylomirabilota bacterium]